MLVGVGLSRARMFTDVDPLRLKHTSAQFGVGIGAWNMRYTLASATQISLSRTSEGSPMPRLYQSVVP